MAEQAVKKEWVTPELIVLVRSNPEEAVLETCKHGTTIPDSGPATNFRDCNLSCAVCAGNAPS